MGMRAESPAFLTGQLTASATPDNRKRRHTPFPLAQIALLHRPRRAIADIGPIG